jgi:hypothetical protein
MMYCGVSPDDTSLHSAAAFADHFADIPERDIKLRNPRAGGGSGSGAESSTGSGSGGGG